MKIKYNILLSHWQATAYPYMRKESESVDQEKNDSTLRANGS